MQTNENRHQAANSQSEIRMLRLIVMCIEEGLLIRLVDVVEI